ncbi:uncharacterized protein BT62DRAFT_1072460 [Guyanagaster necrorhizus]|uniref:HhH-GPD domain-containing protein n=1 Tax=Guyanagaster necrorhizus TaxID=856835 RepID=A0A9P7W1Q6_9AGAR|nr:uncharacterized protein BT62DRAFT_1072460 [Guyanagaster necrorhizus MCA 3950]KAG7450374.1 hypothetical protein BT62DRAFT_1072460 [Guyanagaster necrorhizus MCA 3950]
MTPSSKRKSSPSVASPYFSLEVNKSPSKSILDHRHLHCPYFSPSRKPITREARLDVADSDFDVSCCASLEVHLLCNKNLTELVAHDPWKLIIAVTLLNKTSGKLAIPVFWDLVDRWPTPLSLSQANVEELAGFIRPLGTQTIRAKRLIEMSKSYLLDPPSTYDVRSSKPELLPSSASFSSGQGSPTKRIKYPPTPISHLPGTGRYALDSYRLFCTAYEDPSSQDWKTVIPSDKKLVQYVKWRWAVEECKEWTHGITSAATPTYLRTLISELRDRNPIIV